MFLSIIARPLQVIITSLQRLNSPGENKGLCVCVCVCVCVCARVRACACVFVRARARASIRSCTHRCTTHLHFLIQ